MIQLGRRALPAILALALLVWLGLAVPAGAQDDGADQDGTPATEEATEPAEPSETDEPEPAETEEAEQTADGGEADDVPAEPSELQAAADEGETNAADTSVLQVAEELNLRAEPSLEAEVLTVMPAGAEVTVAAGAAPESDFLPVTYEGEAGWAHQAYLLAGNDNLATVVEDLNLRAEPSLDGEVLAVMPAGTPVRVFGAAEDADGGTWSKVRFADTTGWAFAEFLASGDGSGDSGSGDSAGGGEERIALADLNLRAGPSTDDAVLLVIPAGGSMTLTQEGAQNGFVTVIFDGTSGWVAAEFIARPDELQGTDSGVPAESGGSDVLAGQTRVTLDDLNLRAGPSTDDAVLLVIPAGATVTLTGEGVANDFVTVEYQGTVGWAFAEFLGE